jgi:alkanesulfonate monooxygenase SsuD/methylene tetrahydromethanopterin reductase-like flavin-dependent oxidoreductase (luciferase family)
MRYYLSLPNGGACGGAATLAEFAHLAEGAGWDGVFLEDYIVFQNENGTPTYDPWIALAAMAMRTEQIKLGTKVTALARRRPWKLARETVTIDHLSNGRLILGVGLGVGLDRDIAAFGEATDDRQRAAMLDEALEILVGLWSGRPFSYQGQHYQVSDVTFSPTPRQAPRIPIWVGGRWPNKAPMRRAARWDGVCPYIGRDWTPADVRALKAYIERHRTEPTPFDIAVSGRRQLDPEQDKALRLSLAEAGVTWYGEYVPPAGVEEMRAAIERGPLRIA